MICLIYISGGTSKENNIVDRFCFIVLFINLIQKLSLEFNNPSNVLHDTIAHESVCSQDGLWK